MSFGPNIEEAHVSVDLINPKHLNYLQIYTFSDSVKSYCVSLLLLKAFQVLCFFIFNYHLKCFCCQPEMLTMHLYNSVMTGNSSALCLMTRHENIKCFRGEPKKAPQYSTAHTRRRLCHCYIYRWEHYDDDFGSQY